MDKVSKPQKIGDVINKESEQLKIGGGFDHNYRIDGYDGKTQIPHRRNRFFYADYG